MAKIKFQDKDCIINLKWINLENSNNFFIQKIVGKTQSRNDCRVKQGYYF
jgi:hypothetical protein